LANKSFLIPPESIGMQLLIQSGTAPNHVSETNSCITFASAMITQTMQRMNTISFDDTEIAFDHLSDKELKKSQWLFSLMGNPWMVSLGTRLAPWSLKVGLPVKGIIRKTIFAHFVGGETLNDVIPVAKKMAGYNVQAILDYGVEGKEGEANFDHAKDEFIRVIKFAASQPNIPFMSVKVTGFGRFGLLEKVDALMHQSKEGNLINRYHEAIQNLDENEKVEWNRVYQRMKDISVAAYQEKVGFLVDAEETWIQDPVDALTMLMMDEFNKERVVVYNTYQLYRHDRYAFLKDSFEAAKQRGFILGAKLVRGAYMEKERKRAAEKNYPDPIQPSKDACDRDYDASVRFCIDHLDKIGLIVASHNENSNLLTTQLLKEKGLPFDHPNVHFSQLFGMSDNITYNLAKAGCSVSKYLPFGPIKDVVPYLMRRAQENTSVGGQTSRELGLIKKEIQRRKI
jgi:proline dehydrogenase